MLSPSSSSSKNLIVNDMRVEVTFKAPQLHTLSHFKVLNYLFSLNEVYFAQTVTLVPSHPKLLKVEKCFYILLFYLGG